MKKMNLKRAGAFLLGAALTAAVCLGFLGSSAEATTSLPHIEQLKTDFISNKTSFVVLEIVPNDGTADPSRFSAEGSFGYYISGQEPTAKWLSTVSAIAGKDNRIAYASDLFSRLAANGILGPDTSTPLTSLKDDAGGVISGYQEAYPWENHLGMTEFSLKTPETVTVKGSFIKSADMGDYQAVWSYEIASGTAGTYSQNVTKLTWNGSADFYYNQPVFKMLSAGHVDDKGTPDTSDDVFVFDDVPDGTAVYAAVTGKDATGAPVFQTAADAASAAPSPILYRSYVGTMGQNLQLDGTMQYYTIENLGAPSKTLDAAGGYAAESDGWVLSGDVNGDGVIGSAETAGSGPFTRTMTSCNYVGNGKGEYSFQADDTGMDTANIVTSVSYYKGGYTNNNWFCRYVLDMDDGFDSIHCIVNSVTPDKVTASMVSSADLIVLSGGYGTTAYTASFQSGVQDAIKTAALTATADTAAVPVVVDYALYGKSGDVGSLAKAILDSCNLGTDQDHTFVSENIFCLNTGSSGLKTAGSYESGVLKNLATPNFNAQISADVSGLEAISQEINYENFLRKQQGLSGDLLPDAATVARAVRYILNFGGQRILEEKTAIDVLEVEPATATQMLTEATVRSWLPADTKVTTIRIHPMSIYEFVGRIEDLSETYDMIYLGDSTDRMNLSSGTTVYNDSSMNGLLYSNVGDTVVTKLKLAGMLDRDYTGTGSYQTINTGAGSYTFRYSGNDLTESRKTDLENFAKAGYPVILGNQLISAKQNSGQDLPFTASLTTSAYGTNGAALTVTIQDGSGVTLAANSYTWYSSTDGTNFTKSSLLTGGTVSVTLDRPTWYYCMVGTEGSTVSAKSNTMKLVPGGQIDVDDKATDSEGGSYFDYKNAASLAAAISGIDRNQNYPGSSLLTITASATLNGIATNNQVTYQWYRFVSNRPNNVTKLDGETSKTLTVYPRDNRSYYCEVSVNGSTARTNTIQFDYHHWEWEYSGWVGWYKEYYYSVSIDNTGTTALVGTQVPFFVSASYAVSGNTVTLTGTAKDSAGKAVSVLYRWAHDKYQDYEQTQTWLGNSQSLAVDTTAIGTTETYYCYGFYRYSSGQTDPDYAFSQKVTITKSPSTSEKAAEGTNGLYTVYDEVNAARVDNSSVLYSGLSDILAYGNVMTASKAGASKSTVAKYLNLANAEIAWTNGTSSYPLEFVNNGGVMNALQKASDGMYYLNYAFRIKNSTDATPTLTSYDCRLYLDQDSSGRFSEEEQITDIVVRENGTIIRPVDGKYRLKAGVSYTVSRQMPKSFAGIIHWRLQVSKNVTSGVSYVHASRDGYTRVSGSDAPQKIQILQISSSRTNNHINLEYELQTTTQNTSSSCYSKVTKKTYNGIYGKLIADVTDFDVSIQTIPANQLVAGLKLPADASDTAIYSALVERYNMIIIGFDDMYGELSQASAQAVVKFIGSGKSVLFTHDTTSLSNIDFTTMKNSGLSFTEDPSYWGYYFNSILRTPVGLDRYGIRSDSFGSAVRSQTASSDLTETQISALTGGDFSIAYQPNSARTHTVAEAQGYTNYGLIRYKTSGSAFVTGLGALSTRPTTSVSQLNKGQITTYPYNVNTALFNTGSGSDAMSVGLTHEQPYQINLNSDDTVVWYCLNSSFYLKNDAMSAYYIFSKGNVTYSGMGHSGSDVRANYEGSTVGQQYQNEAMLFVNTMIAAYRTVVESPTVKFTPDATGNETEEYYFLTSDSASDSTDSSVLENAFGANTDSTVAYFRLSDPNLNKNKAISASLSYTSDAAVTTYDKATAVGTLPDVAIAETGASASFSSLSGGVVYKFHLPQPVLDELGKSGVNSVRLFLHITTTIDGKDYENTAVLNVRKLSLSNLK